MAELCKGCNECGRFIVPDDHKGEYCPECCRKLGGLCDCGCGERVRKDAVVLAGWYVNPGHEPEAVAAALC